MKVAYLFQPKLMTGSSHQGFLLCKHIEMFKAVSSAPIVGTGSATTVDWEGVGDILYPFEGSIVKTLEQMSPDVVLVHTINKEVVEELGGIVKLFPTVIRFGVNLYELLMRGEIGWNMIGSILMALDMVDCIICPSELVAENLNTIGYLNTVVIPTAVDCQEWKLTNPEREIMVSMGRLEPIKNYFSAILIAKTVGQKRPQFSYKMCGAGAQRGELMNFIQLFGASWVQMLGYVDARDMLQEAKVFLQPSISENCSLSLLEAMASGVPVVASNIEGHAEGNVRLEHLNDYVLEIERLLDDSDYWKLRSEQVLKIAQQYDVRRLKICYEELLKKVVRLRDFKKGLKL